MNPYQVHVNGLNGFEFAIRINVFPTAGPNESRAEINPNSIMIPNTNSLTQGRLFDDFFIEWSQGRTHQTSLGWQEEQRRLYKIYVSPEVGKLPIETIDPKLVSALLGKMAAAGKSPQTQLHVFSLLKKMFSDAIEVFRLATFNPVLKSLRPRVPIKEARHFNVKQSQILLRYVEKKPAGLGIWLQLYLGLRVGELIALKWEDIDLESKRVHIRRTYVRKDKCFKDYPKGRKQHSMPIPREIVTKLMAEKQLAKSDFVVTRKRRNLMIPYEWYYAKLRRYCKEAEVPVVGTHGLRHSTSELYMSHGATRDDLMLLFAHSSVKITDRYVHDRGTNLEKITDRLKLF